MRLKSEKLDYKWIILVVCFFMEFICLGFCSGNDGLYLIAVTEALDISRSAFSLQISIRYVTQIVAAWFFGSLSHRFGLKKLVCVGLISLVSCMLIRSVATNVFHLYISSVFLGIGIVFVGSTMAGTIVRRWFHQDVGRYTGIVMSANGIGGALAAQIISPIINNGETFGYRGAYLLAGLFTLAISIVVVFFFREHPKETPAMETGAKKKLRGAAWVGIEYDVVKRKPYFYLVAVMVFLTGIGLQSIGSITTAHMYDVGLSVSFVATNTTISALILTVSKFMVGFTYDKRGLHFTLFICHVMTVVAFILKALLNGGISGMIFATVASCCTCFALPLETVMLPLIANDLFGTASYSKVFGVLAAMNSLGLCLGAPIGNLYFDAFKTYVPCFWFFCILMVAVTIGFQFAIRAAHKDKEAILAASEETV